MVVFEAMHVINRKQNGPTGFMAVKLDINKAYDLVE